MSLAAFFGMFNGMGRDRGAALVLEQAAMPSIVGEGNRTRTFAWYNIVQDLGHALGSLMAGLPYLLRTMGGVPVESSYQNLARCLRRPFRDRHHFQFAPFIAHRSAWRFRAPAGFSQNPESPLSPVGPFRLG